MCADEWQFCVCVCFCLLQWLNKLVRSHMEKKSRRGGGHRSARVGKEGGENGMMFFSVVTQVVECVR